MLITSAGNITPRMRSVTTLSVRLIRPAGRSDLQPERRKRPSIRADETIRERSAVRALIARQRNNLVVKTNLEMAMLVVVELVARNRLVGRPMIDMYKRKRRRKRAGRGMIKE